MATVLASPERAMFQQLSAGLSNVNGVLSVHTQWVDGTLNVWIGLRDEDVDSRQQVYSFEDSFLDSFDREANIEFHVLTIPNGKKIEDFISEAHSLFQRSA